MMKIVESVRERAETDMREWRERLRTNEVRGKENKEKIKGKLKGKNEREKRGKETEEK